MAGLAREAERGIHGVLDARFAADGGVTLHSRSPLELRGPFRRNHGAPLYYLRNVTSGILAGDSYDVSLCALPNVKVQIASSSAAKAYDCSRAPAGMTTAIEALPGSRLVWGPHTTILQAGASLTQATHITVHEGASVVCAEVLSFGRLASGERLSFARYESVFVVQTPDGQLLYEERYLLRPEPALETTLAHYGALASVYVLGTTVSNPHLLSARTDEQYAGSSELPNGAGFVVKALVANVSAGVALCEAVLADL